MSIFSNKESVKLEDIIPVMIQAAFEYPTIDNLTKVDRGANTLSKSELKIIVDEVPIFIVVINVLLLMFAAEQGKIERFKGDTSNEIGKTLGYAFTATSGLYLQNKGMNEKDSAHKAGEVFNKAMEYIDKIGNKLTGNPLPQEIFFEVCSKFQSNIIGKFDVSKVDKSFIAFDFAKQLYRNIESSFNKLKIS